MREGWWLIMFVVVLAAFLAGLWVCSVVEESRVHGWELQG